MPKSTFLRLAPQRQAAFKKAVYRLFAKKDYELIGIRDIADACGIALGSFYRYFDDKDSMYLDFFSEIEAKMLGGDIIGSGYLHAPDYGSYVAGLLSRDEIAFGETWYRVPSRVMYRFYFEGYAERLSGAYKDLFQKLHSEAKLRSGISPDFALFFFNTAFFNFLMYLRRLGISDAKTVYTMKQVFNDEVLMRGLVSDKAIRASKRRTVKSRAAKPKS